MSQPIPLFVELCAGTAALSLRLQQRKARPPVSRQGAKTGYADAILRVLGLRPGQRAEHYLWCEPDPGCRLLLEAYRDRALALAAAEIIRGWKDEEPRALWERLRAEGPPVGPPADAREVARFIATKTCQDARGQFSPGNFDGRTIVSRSGRVDFWRPQGLEGPAGRLDSAPGMPAFIAPDARTVDPREVARWAWVQRRTIDPGGYFNPQDKPTTALQHGGREYASNAPSKAFDALPALPATITDDARPIEPADLPPGTVAYMDPPYLNTTGYAADLGRAEVVDLARRWDAAGAVVCISEAEPIPELVADGWHAVEITGARVGQKRTFSKQQREWLTLNRPPAWTVPVQGDLFG